LEIKEIKRLDDGKPYAIEVRNEYNDLKIHIKWDGCIDISKYWNGTSPENNDEDNTDYIHVCEVKEFIKELQSVVNIAEKNFSKDNFNDYWE